MTHQGRALSGKARAARSRRALIRAHGIAGITWHHRLIATLSALLPLVLVPKDAPLKRGKEDKHYSGGRSTAQRYGEQPSQKTTILQCIAQSDCELGTMRWLRRPQSRATRKFHNPSTHSRAARYRRSPLSCDWSSSKSTCSRSRCALARIWKERNGTSQADKGVRHQGDD